MSKEEKKTHIDKKLIFGIPIYLEKKEKNVEPHLFDLKGRKWLW